MPRKKKQFVETHAWPGYVDALSTLLMVIIFVLLVFVLGQALLSILLVNKEHNLQNLASDKYSLLQQLADAQRNSAQLTQKIQEQALAQQNYSQQINALKKENQSTLQELSTLQATLQTKSGQFTSLQALQTTTQNNLQAAHQEIMQNHATITVLTNKLNHEMAAHNSPLMAFRNEFYTHLKDQLKSQPGLGVVEDRFIFQSEILFPPGNAELSPDGIKAIITLAHTLVETARHIPPDIPWLLRVDGHADKQPIHSSYASNWELSTARAIAVVKQLIANGVPPQHLAATGFAEYQPLNTEDTPTALAKNRRIEFRLTNK